MILFRKSGTGSYSSLISVLLLYLLLMALVLVFSNQVLSELEVTPSPFGGVILVATVAFPAFLAVLVLVNVARLVRDRALGKPGVPFKIRLMLFFTVVVLLSAVPQAILSANFIRTMLDAWYSEPTGEALRSGQRLALDYYGRTVDDLDDFVSGSLFRQVVRDADRVPRQVWDDIQQLKPRIDSFQVFTADTLEELFFEGPNEARLSESQVLRARSDTVSRDSSGGRSFLRIRTDVEGGTGRPIITVLSVFLPEAFDTAADQLSRGLETFAQIEELRGVFLTAIFLFYVVFATPILLLAVLVSFLLSDEIIRPLVNLEEATRRVAEGDFSFRILTRSNDDVGMLVQSFNRMISELDRSRKKMIQTEKIAAWQEIAQRLAHEIKNPLTPIRLSAERLRRKYRDLRDDPEQFARVLERSVDNILREVNGLNELLGEFSSFSRMPAPQPAPVKIRGLVAEVAGSYSGDGTAVVRYDDVDAELEVPVDAAQMKQVLANLFKNAIEAAGGEVTIVVRSDLVKRGNSRYCRLQIRDNGPGIDEADQAEIFNPYYTTKRHGTGLGLAIVERIVFDHQGQIWFESVVGTGTTFFIDLPLSRDEKRQGSF